MHSGQNAHFLTHKKSAKILAPKSFFMSFEAQKINFLGLFGRENFKKMAPKLLKVNMYVDGGIPIKSLVQRSNLVPNFTSLLQNECECVQFDFKKIDVLS